MILYNMWYFNNATILVQWSMDVYMVFTKYGEDAATNYQIPFETICSLK